MASSLDSWVREYNEASKLADDINNMISERGETSGHESKSHTSAIRRKLTILFNRLETLDLLLPKLPNEQPMNLRTETLEERKRPHWMMHLPRIIPRVIKSLSTPRKGIIRPDDHITENERHEFQAMLTNLKSKARQITSAFYMSIFANRENLQGPGGKLSNEIDSNTTRLEYNGIFGLQHQIMKEQDESLDNLGTVAANLQHALLRVNEEPGLYARLLDSSDQRVGSRNSHLQTVQTTFGASTRRDTCVTSLLVFLVIVLIAALCWLIVKRLLK